MASGTRQAAVAGSFYPDNPLGLKTLLKNYFSHSRPIALNPKALILPHAGYIYSGPTAAWGFKQLKPTKNQHFVLLGPSHHGYFSGLAGSTDKFWQTPLGKIAHLPAKDFLNNQPHQLEHCLEVQLPFLQFCLPEFSFTAFLTGELSHQETADYLIKAYPDSIFLVSSDLSHYLPETVANKTDQTTIDAILKLNSGYFADHDNVACGTTAIQILLGIAKTKHWLPQLLCYDTSASASGDKSQVVGYASLGFYE
ncbi:MAG: AmmeMemoRadiSam system protein B [Candidatus Beckwithbacteria bacterium]|nr:AmmeMemoRadiSam system protein B [Candidatus Beckwithbacteria bacterium]